MTDRPPPPAAPGPGAGARWSADEALEQLYAAHWRRLVRLSVLLVHDQGTAEEVVQDAFVAVHGRWGRLRDPKRALAYLRQTVVNRSRSALRHRAVVDRRTVVLDALRDLPERQREVLALRYYLDLSEAQISGALGISRGAVKSHASRGAAALRARLGSLLEDDLNLSDLLHDAVDDLEPTDRLDALRSRTSSAGHLARPWWWAAGGVVAATAATVVLVAALGGGPDPSTPTAGSGHEGHDEPTEVPGEWWTLLPTYYLGDTPGGQRLFREFVPVQTDDALQAALDRIQETPEDPDYFTPWPEGSLTSASVDDDVIRVQMGDVDPSVASNTLGRQQVVYTLQAVLGRRLPVAFVQDGQDSSGGLGAAPASAVLNQVNISDPAELTAYSGSMIARGRANATEGRLRWQLSAAEGGPVVRHGVIDLADRTGLQEWETTVDLTGLDVGTYLFEVQGTSWSDGVPAADTRRISVS